MPHVSLAPACPPKPTGRPRRFGDLLSEKLWIRLSAGEVHALRRIARMNGQTLTDFMREAIVDACADCTDDLVLVPRRRVSSPRRSDHPAHSALSQPTRHRGL